MEIINFKLHTKQNESILLKEVDCISIGEVIPADARIWESNKTDSPKKIYVYSKKGNFSFDLIEVDYISFALLNEKYCVCIDSKLINNIEGGE